MSVTLRNKSILCTGGSGSFGTAFVKRALAEGAARVVIFSRDEAKQAAMAQALPDSRLRFFVGDVRDADRLAVAMRGVDICVHAAALKRIEVCEANPDEAVLTNVLGTMNVAHACIDAGVERAVFLSTDKAPAAHTLYGATKFCAERLWIQSNAYAAGTGTKLSATRYGNVLGSRGSVLQLWREQAARGEPLTVTSSGMSRFWMSLDQAVGLVLLALREMRGGEVFVGRVPSAPLLTLAEAVAPGAPLTETGMRGAERLHETLISPEEAPYTYAGPDYFIIEPALRTWGEAPPLAYPLVPEGFSYRSDTNDAQYTVDGLRKLVAA